MWGEIPRNKLFKFAFNNSIEVIELNWSPYTIFTIQLVVKSVFTNEW